MRNNLKLSHSITIMSEILADNITSIVNRSKQEVLHDERDYVKACVGLKYLEEGLHQALDSISEIEKNIHAAAKSHGFEQFEPED